VNNYSDANLENLKKDLNKTIDECKELVKKLKASEDVELNHFNDIESIIYDLSGRVAFLGDVHPDEKIRDFGNEADSIIQNFALEIFNDSDLYEKYNEIDISSLDEESLSFHKDLGLDFKDAGHGLLAKNKERLTEIEKKLIELGISFSENIAKDKTELLFLEDELRGLSSNELGNLRREGNKFVITMAYPDVNAVIENCTVRETRESVWKAFNNRSVEANSPILQEAVVLRNEKAKLFGFNTWSEYRLQNRMAKTPMNVSSMYENLIPKLQKAANNEKNDLAIDGIGVNDIAPWDIRYFISAERAKASNIENSELKKYFYILVQSPYALFACHDQF